jgi:uncharacterized OB-fold protein
MALGLQPTPSTLTAPFWDAVARQTLVRQVCSECGTSFFTPQIACPRCLSEQWSWVESTGFGFVYSYTICHRSPQPDVEVPYVLAIIDLDEGWSMLSNVVGCEPTTVQIGMRVRVTWRELRGSSLLPVFEPMFSE